MTLKEKIELFPHSPGVYRYYDSEGIVIYVGKAKDLRKRVSQYFVSPERLNTKTRLLVAKIADAKYSVVDSEADALLLENNLIKQYKPKYNILLKDSKSYPWICISGENFPKVFITRRLHIKGARYFGPYSSSRYARALVDFFHENYKLRTCKYKITSDAITRGKYRPCLSYHIGKCGGCCVGKVSVKEYETNIEEIISLLKGGVKGIIRSYRDKMNQAAEELRFEDAQQYKERIEALNKHYSKSVITMATDNDCDIFSLISEADECFGNMLRVRGGAVVSSINMGFKMNIEEDMDSILSEFIAEVKSQFGSLAEEIIVPFMPDVLFEGSEYKIPIKGDKMELLTLSTKNAKEFKFNTMSARLRKDPEEYRTKVLEELRDAIGMNVLPSHIECFDNSNIQGTNPVAACVVFRDGVPSKKDYRKFKVKTVVGANDYASMKEIVNRRYSRMLRENPEDLPQLIVIDGGKGQLAFAYQALSELGLTDKLTVIALAERLEEIIRVGDPYPLFLDRNSQALKLVQHLRDEAHRFGITFHRSLRGKAQVKSILREVKGVGEQTERRLIMHFGSVPRIARAKEEDIAAVVGPVLANKVYKKLHEKRDND